MQSLQHSRVPIQFRLPLELLGFSSLRSFAMDNLLVSGKQCQSNSSYVRCADRSHVAKPANPKPHSSMKCILETRKKHTLPSIHFAVRLLLSNSVVCMHQLSGISCTPGSIETLKLYEQPCGRQHFMRHRIEERLFLVAGLVQAIP